MAATNVYMLSVTLKLNLVVLQDLGCISNPDRDLWPRVVSTYRAVEREA